MRYQVVLKQAGSEDMELTADQFNETENFACFTTFSVEEMGVEYSCFRVALSEILAIREF